VKKRILTLGIVVALVAVLAVPMAALGDNQAGQGATTMLSTTIGIVSKSTDVAVTTITFPPGAPSSTVDKPYNNLDSGDPQFLDTMVSEPVVRLLNTSGGTLTVTLKLPNDWTNDVVTAEYYELVDTANTTVDSVDMELSADGNAAEVATGVSINAAAYKALYLKVDLSALAGVSGGATIAILGES